MEGVFGFQAAIMDAACACLLDPPMLKPLLAFELPTFGSWQVKAANSSHTEEHWKEGLKKLKVVNSFQPMAPQDKQLRFGGHFLV